MKWAGLVARMGEKENACNTIEYLTKQTAPSITIICHLCIHTCFDIYNVILREMYTKTQK
jgi:hypothetical protein